MPDIPALQEKCRLVRRDVIKSVHLAGSGHPGGSLSAVELLVALYHYKMNVDPNDPRKPDRDRFILSKGHASPALYAVLADRGFFPRDYLWTLRKTDGALQGAPGLTVPGIDMSSGSLGQGVSVGVGMAYAGRMQKLPYHTYVLMGDGELQEGIAWEAFMAAAHYRLGNLVIIIDNNHVQMCGNTCDIMGVESLRRKFEAFDCKVLEVNGHDLEAIIKVLDGVKDTPDAPPTVVIADTVKGKGVSFMEGTAKWHGGAPSKEQYEEAMRELGGQP